MAVKWFKILEHSLRAKSRFDEFADAVREYLEMDHAEPVPESQLERPRNELFYLPMYMVRKETSTTSKVWVVLTFQPRLCPEHRSTSYSLDLWCIHPWLTFCCD